MHKISLIENSQDSIRIQSSNEIHLLKFFEFGSYSCVFDNNVKYQADYWGQKTSIHRLEVMDFF